MTVGSKEEGDTEQERGGMKRITRKLSCEDKWGVGWVKSSQCLVRQLPCGKMKENGWVWVGSGERRSSCLEN